MKLIKITIVLVGMMATAALCTAGEPESEPEPAPSWDTLADRASEISISRLSPEDLKVQIEKKEARLDSLHKQQGALEAQLVAVIDSSPESIAEIEEIEDPILRDESLLRFRSTRNTRLKTIQATLAAVNEDIDREERELATLQRVLQGRRAEARLYGADGGSDNPNSYREYLSTEAQRVRTAEAETVRRVREGRLEKLGAAIFPLSEPRVPNLTDIVLTMTREK